jgi:hypothetical protein
LPLLPIPNTYEEIHYWEMFAVLCLTLFIWATVAAGRTAWFTSSLLKHIGSKSWRGPVYTILLALLLRGALQPALGTPLPRVHDEFSYLLMADTFSHLKVTNPTPAAWQHFESFHINMTPSYQSKYPVAQGITLALGKVLFDSPWLGVYLSTALLAGAICWALQAFVPLEWAFLGGVLCVLKLGLFNYWMNSYWGGSVAALGGALALGATARMLWKSGPRQSYTRCGVTLGVGLCIMALSRPFEGVLFSIPLLISLAVALVVKNQPGQSRLNVLRGLAAAIIPVIAGLAFVAYYNYRVTGNALLLPYSVNERTYSATPLFLWVSPYSTFPHYHHRLMKNFYEGFARGPFQFTRTWYGLTSWEQMRSLEFWNFYLGPLQTLPLAVGIIATWHNAKLRLALFCLAATSIACLAATFFHPHYFAPAAVCLYVLVVYGMYWLWKSHLPLVKALGGGACAAILIFAVLESNVGTYAYMPQLTSREIVSRWLDKAPGKHLVVVEYFGLHSVHNELGYNGADLSKEQILWTRKMTASEDTELCRAYPERTFWELKTSDDSLVLRPSSLCNSVQTTNLGGH